MVNYIDDDDDEGVEDFGSETLPSDHSQSIVPIRYSWREYSIRPVVIKTEVNHLLSDFFLGVAVTLVAVAVVAVLLDSTTDETQDTIQ